MSLEVVNLVLDAIVFSVDAPNATEGNRHFTITVINQDDPASDPLGTSRRVSEPVAVELRPRPPGVQPRWCTWRPTNWPTPTSRC